MRAVMRVLWVSTTTPAVLAVIAVSSPDGMVLVSENNNVIRLWGVPGQLLISGLGEVNV
jgi:hypothetical protein